jgi:hypothetical protein
MAKKNLILLLMVLACTRVVAIPSAGFFLPDSVFEFSMRYKTIDNLIILPVSINDSVTVNLILDTGCRNMVLFGKRFEKLFLTQARDIEFSGHGSGKPVVGKLSLNNEVSIGMVHGRRIPLIIVPQKNLFSTLPNVHGVIGYEIFSKFEIEFNFPEKTITFRSALSTFPYPGFSYIPMSVVDSRPVLRGVISSGSGDKVINDLLIDTGSSLGLMISLDEKQQRDAGAVGRGFNGLVRGRNETTQSLRIDDVSFTNISTSIVYSEKHSASIGMEILKDHVVIVNYARSYVAFRNNS